MNLSNEPYLKEQIITYIGNKRKLIGLIHGAIQSLYGEIPPGLKFLDLFSGSGVVSRLAKFLNMEVHSNDWEEYSYIINYAYLTINASEIQSLFEEEKGLNTLINYLNELPDPEPENQYITLYYSTNSEDPSLADFKKERLFYTRQNGLIIDKIRNKIDELYPEAKASLNTDILKKRSLLLSLLIFQASKHTNTSGVFKACHKGFGGHGKDALKRILGKITLPCPILIDSDHSCYVYKEDASSLVKRICEMDIVYLDPPYNSHQYGSNYHMLNTISLWDKIPALLKLNSRGELKEKAGIRKDWIKTKSDYCYPQSAVAAFQELIEHIRATYILVSYSTDGIIPFDTMTAICSKKGSLSLFTGEYIKYRGGKQSNNRLVKNIEFLIIIDTRQGPQPFDQSLFSGLFAGKKIALILQERFSMDKIKSMFKSDESHRSFSADINGKEVIFKTKFYFQITGFSDLAGYCAEQLQILYTSLAACRLESKEMELEEIFHHIHTTSEQDELEYFFMQIPATIKRLAHKKNKNIFMDWFNRIQSLNSMYPDQYKKIHKKIETIKEIAQKRFTN